MRCRRPGWWLKLWCVYCSLVDGLSAFLTFTPSAEHSLYALDGLRTCAVAMNKLSPKNTLRKTIPQGFREQWYPTLAFLRRTRTGSTSIGEHDQLTMAWQTLGEELGLNENTQKADYEREIRKALRRCAWKGCQYHEKEPPVSLRACKGCADAVRTVLTV